jgi:hypothetical protein
MTANCKPKRQDVTCPCCGDDIAYHPVPWSEFYRACVCWECYRQLHGPTEGDPITDEEGEQIGYWHCELWIGKERYGPYCITGPDGGVKDWHETPGNARLAASASDLLEALEDTCSILEDDHYKCNIDSDQDCRLHEEFNHAVMRRANQAIAKAKGKVTT